MNLVRMAETWFLVACKVSKFPMFCRESCIGHQFSLLFICFFGRVYCSSRTLSHQLLICNYPQLYEQLRRFHSQLIISIWFHPCHPISWSFLVVSNDRSHKHDPPEKNAPLCGWRFDTPEGRVQFRLIYISQMLHVWNIHLAISMYDFHVGKYSSPIRRIWVCSSSDGSTDRVQIRKMVAFLGHRGRFGRSESKWLWKTSN